MATLFPRPKRRLAVLLMCLFAVLGSCDSNTPWEREQLEKLQWLRTADAEAAFKKDQKASRIRFYQIYGFTLITPGIDIDVRIPGSCYHWVETMPIEGTSDALFSDEHFYLVKRARRFARKYNLLMKDHIDRAGLRSCPPKGG